MQAVGGAIKEVGLPMQGRYVSIWICSVFYIFLDYSILCCPALTRTHSLTSTRPCCLHCRPTATCAYEGTLALMLYLTARGGSAHTDWLSVTLRAKRGRGCCSSARWGASLPHNRNRPRNYYRSQLVAPCSICTSRHKHMLTSVSTC